MANTSVIQYDVAPDEHSVANVTGFISNTTTKSDAFDWASWSVALLANPVYKAAIWTYAYYIFIDGIVGIPCNILSYLVLRRLKPLTSAILIMLVLAIVDSLCLITSVLDRMRHLIFPGSQYMDIGCSLLMTARYVFQYMPIWLVVLLTLERVVAVCFPMKAAQVCTISNARRSIIGLVILDILISLIHTFVYESSGSSCPIKRKYRQLLLDWGHVDAIFFVYIPLLTLCLGNVSIIVKLRTAKEIDNEASTSEENIRQNRSVTVMLLAVSITTILCIGPNAIFHFVDGNNWLRTYDQRAYARRYLAIWIIMFLAGANNAVNFFLYVLSGRRFRAVLYEMVASWFGRKRPRAIY